MFFAASVAHANEIMESLPTSNSAMITGETDKKERERIIKSYVAGELKYLVNVAVLTTGFDAPIVDTIAILRRTESPALFLQIIGRGVRLHENKKECLVLDYAENLGNVVSNHDPFEPIIQVKGSKPGARYEFICPSCQHVNNFALNKDFEGANYNSNGYLVSDITGQPIKDDQGEFISVHMGQKCQAVDHLGNSCCNHYWDGKECPECGHMNSKSARYCGGCNHELIDPNKKLVLTESVANNRNPYEPKTVEVVKSLINTPNAKGNIRIDHYINGRVSPLFSEFVNPAHERVGYAAKSKKVLSVVAPNFDHYVLPTMVEHPKTILITYQKQKGGDFFDAKDHKVKDTA
jgi:DNA repair protein RadD